MRPTARAVLNHPLFWHTERVLSFLQDVSDRVEKAQLNTEPLRTLEKNATLIVKDDWNTQLEPEITNDLRKFRGYQGGSVRDLLRALRNKVVMVTILTFHLGLIEFLSIFRNITTTSWTQRSSR